MTNDFSSLKNRAESNKFLLIRMTVAKSIVDSLVSGGSYIYTATLSLDSFDYIKAEGNLCTEVSIITGDYQYIFNSTTRLLTIRLSVPTLLSPETRFDVIVYRYIYLTNDTAKITYKDPEDSSTELKDWLPRISGYPSFEISQQDIIDSVLTIGSTSIELINNDNYFQQFIEDEDSFSRQDVKIWQCLDSVNNIQKFYFGFVTSFSISTSNISLSIDSSMSLLNDTFYSNGTLEESTYSQSTYPGVHPDFRDKAIYKIYSKCSRTVLVGIGNEEPFSPLNGSSQVFFKIDEGYELTNINYNVNRSIGNNREWSACIASSTSSDLTETASNVTAQIPNNRYWTDVDDIGFYRCGDCLLINSNPGYYVHGIDLGSSRIMISTSGTLAVVLSNGDTIFRPAIPFVQLIDDDNNGVALLKYGTSSDKNVSHYRLIVDSNGVYKIIINYNIESIFSTSQFNTNGGIAAAAKIYYRVYNHDDLNHGTIVKEIIESVGFVADNDSITAANLTSIKTNFSNPFVGEGSFKAARDVLQSLLTSTMGLLSQSSDFSLAYKLISLLSSVVEITDNEIINGSLKQDIKYTDIYTAFKYENKHGEYSALNDSISSTIDTRYEESLSLDRPTAIHGIKKEKKIDFITQDLDNSKDRIESLLSSRRATFSFVTKGINFSSTIGDDLTIISNKLIGTSGQKIIKILSINKKQNETAITGSDLYGL